MAVDDLDFDDLEPVIEALAAIGIQASMDSSKLRPPAVWIKFDGIGSEDTLGGLVIKTRLFAVVGKTNEAWRANKALALLWNKVRPVVQKYGGPSGDVTAPGLVLSGSTAVLPALSIPLDLVVTHDDPDPAP